MVLKLNSNLSVSLCEKRVTLLRMLMVCTDKLLVSGYASNSQETIDLTSLGHRRKKIPWVPVQIAKDEFEASCSPLLWTALICQTLMKSLLCVYSTSEEKLKFYLSAASGIF